MADAQGNRYGPYDIEVAGSEAEALTEEAWFDLFGHVTGVKSGGALTFNGLTATLAPIDMRVHGSYLIRVDPWSIASPATAAGANPRRDMLVARRQRTSGEGAGAIPGKTFLTLLQGGPAATPADPTPDSDDDEPLWSWQVPGGGGTVVTDVRDRRRFLLPGGGTLPPIVLCTMSSGWSAAASQKPGAFKDASGLIHLVGHALNGAAYDPNDGFTTRTVLTLPTGYWPASPVQFMMHTSSAGTGRIVMGEISTLGVLRITGGTTGIGANFGHFLSAIPPFHPRYAGDALT